jgi:nucleoside-diphosphate-sugar epimerase
MEDSNIIIRRDERILITGSAGFIGTRLVRSLLSQGFANLCCFVRPSSGLKGLKAVFADHGAEAEIMEGNLLNPADCEKSVEGVSVVFHLAAGRGDKSYPNAFLNSVVTTRNLLSACLARTDLKRFVNISSFAVYSARGIRHNGFLDESCPIENNPVERGEAYCYAKVRQDGLVLEYARKHNLPVAIVRPGFVYGPGNRSFSGRVGIGTFGIFLHLGGSNLIPFSYVDNCADAIAAVGLVKGCDGETFNIVDDDLPTSRRFLRLYKKNTGWFPSLYVPRFASYLLCLFWERYADWSHGQLPPVFNRNRWAANWKGHRYSNRKLKEFTGWKPAIDPDEGFRRYFEYLGTIGRTV